MTYPYSNLPLGPDPENYMYTALQGPEYLGGYLRSRETALAHLPEPSVPAAPPTLPELPPLPGDDRAVEVDTDSLLRGLVAHASAGTGHPGRSGWTTVLRQKFEVAKRLRDRYHPNGRPVSRDTWGEVSRYVHLAFVLSSELDASRVGDGDSLRTLNALLKADDLVAARAAELSGELGGLAATAITREIQTIRELMSHKRMGTV